MQDAINNYDICVPVMKFRFFFITDRQTNLRTLVIITKVLSVMSLQQLITVRNDRTQLETQFNRAQHKLKTMYEEFSSRLNRYVNDIAVRS